MTAATSHASPRLFKRYQRHAHFDRLRYRGEEIEFLTVEAARLGTTEAILWQYLFTNTADQIKAAATLGALKSPGTFYETGS